MSEENNRKIQKISTTPDIIDVLVICWGVICIAFLAEATWSKWTGKAEFIITESILLLLAWIYLGIRRLSQPGMFRWRSVPAGSIPYLLIMAAAAAILLDELDSLVGLVIPIPDYQLQNLQQAFAPNSFSEAILIITGVAIVAPITEESLFRGVVQQTFERRWDITSAVLVSSLIFSVIHLQPWWMIQQAVLAVLLGYLSWRWNSIIPAVIVHGANNLWAIRNIAGLSDEFIRIYTWGKHVNPVLIAMALVTFTFGLIKSEQVRRSRAIQDQC